jgi:hypothetical protein
MGDNLDSEVPAAPPPPGANKVEIAVGGHSITVESAEPLAEVVGYALGIYDQTKDAARKIPFGFDVTGGQFELAEPYVEVSQETAGGDDARRMGRQPAQDGTTRRLVIDDPPGHHRARLRPVSVDRGRAQVPVPGH